LAMLAPRRDEFPVLGEFHDAVVAGSAMAVGDIDVAIGRDDDTARPVQEAGTVAGHSGLTQGHQHLALRAEFDNHVALAVLRALVGYPHIALVVDIKAMRLVEHVGAERPDELAGGIELLDRWNHRIGAVVRCATVEHPNALAVAVINLHLDGLAKFPALG